LNGARQSPSPSFPCTQYGHIGHECEGSEGDGDEDPSASLGRLLGDALRERLPSLTSLTMESTDSIMACAAVLAACNSRPSPLHLQQLRLPKVASPQLALWADKLLDQACQHSLRSLSLSTVAPTDTGGSSREALAAAHALAFLLRLCPNLCSLELGHWVPLDLSAGQPLLASSLLQHLSCGLALPSLPHLLGSALPSLRSLRVCVHLAVTAPPLDLGTWDLDSALRASAAAMAGAQEGVGGLPFFCFCVAAGS